MLYGNITFNASFSDSLPTDVFNYTPHPSIYIEGNEDFTLENGVIGGDGSSNNPFLLQGWEIIPTERYGITIIGTTAHFTIKECYIHEGSEESAVISFGNIQNGKIVNTIVTHNADNGLHVWDSHDIHLENCTFNENGRRGINFNEVYNVTIFECEMSKNSDSGLFFGTCTNGYIKDCIAQENQNRGINFNEAYFVTLKECKTLKNGGNGLYIGDGNYDCIIDCISNDNSKRGITIGGGDNVSILHCQGCSNNDTGLLCGTSSFLQIEQSVFTDNKGHGVCVNHGTNVRIGYCNVSGNNWSGISGKMSNLDIIECNFSDNENGVTLSLSNNISAYSNIVSNNKYGIYLFSCDNFCFKLNDFIDNQIQALSLVNNIDIASFIHNYWSNYKMLHPFAREKNGEWNRPHFFLFGMDKHPSVNPL